MWNTFNDCVGIVCPEMNERRNRDNPSAKIDGIEVAFVPSTRIVLVPTIAKEFSMKSRFPANSSRFNNVDKDEKSIALDSMILKSELTDEYVIFSIDPPHWKICIGRIVLD